MAGGFCVNRKNDIIVGTGFKPVPTDTNKKTKTKMSDFKRSKNRKNNRLKDFDYSQNGEYFVTICVDGMEEHLGEIKDGGMVLNECGRVVKNQILWLEKQYPYIKLDEWVVMPNHVHMIIFVDNDCVLGVPVGTGRDLSLQKIKIKSLSEIIGAFKTTSSKKIHQLGFGEFKWQRSFYDHIIGDENELDRIRDYILSNPSKWSDDRNNPLAREIKS